MKKFELLDWINNNFINLGINIIEQFPFEKTEDLIRGYRELQSLIKDKSYSEKMDILRNIEGEATLKYHEDLKLRKEISKAKYKQEKIEAEKRTEKFKKIIKPGMVVKMNGTNDGIGFRLVLSMDDFQLTCQKLSRKRKNNQLLYSKEKYITTHYWNKISKILQDDINIPIKIN